jgi:enoyl-CoA hydratase/3-hydroxyacyl-CoA dehydrogenase
MLGGIGMADRVTRVAVIGVGTMGSDLSLLFALSDFNVVVNDISPAALDKLEEKQRSTMDELHTLGLTNKEYETVREKITVAHKLEDIKDVDFVLEAVKEDLDVKRKLFAYLDKLPREVVLATNTSSLRVSDIARGLKGADRIALMHFSNPPILSPLAEVMKGEKTSEKTLRIVSGVAESIGRTPVVLRKEMNGAILNRILLNINNDALWALQSKELTQAELDASFRSIGWQMGVTGTLDQIGLDVALDVGVILAGVYGLRVAVPKSPLPKMVREGKLGKKSGIGFYDWSKGPPVIDKKLAGKYDTMRVFANAANEAFWIIRDEMADPKTIDTITKLGFRSSKFGVCEIADSIGLDKLREILKNLYTKYGLEMYKTCPLFDEYVKNGWTGKAAGRGFYTYPAPVEAVESSV